MTTARKKQWVQDFSQDIQGGDFSLLFGIEGVKASSLVRLRRLVRDAGGQCKVVNNRLAKLSVQGSTHEVLSSEMKGALGMAWGGDPVTMSKIFVDFSKEESTAKVVGASLSRALLGAGDVKRMASMPSLDVLRAQLAAVMIEPVRRLVCVVSEPVRGLARLIHALKETK